MSRTVLVTGGNRGIGLEIARTMADAGDKVAVTYRTGEPPADFFGVRCDVNDADDAQRALAEVVQQFGPVQVLVANAGVTKDALAPLMAEEDFRSVLETNLVSAFRFSRLVAPEMIRSRWGRIVFMSSVMGFLGSPGQVNYASSKAGLLGLTRSLAWELGSRNITVNMVTPGLIETDMIKGVKEKRRDALIAQTALRRTGTPAEVAEVVRFLTGNAASFVTGASIPVGGGLAMGQ
ncbi:SDR family oxidoreductase [Streptomyces nitrosporeus]|uniref:SDR family oxidoreductase n=1 Tax=Streptomyces nitrosporeus TaxID=28894 RepID=A0A5J6FHE1_9ACTN|nr:3-oxoacyl-ACP reductase FabG [Streptomyces nitrosporeus]QEU75742.1 SDR family oxidoreductase [Streptomyces nitrosporeus]GGY87685.1 beta-ketoacyl-ACP reductase [Streptomyces nitrosporeus]